MTENFEDFKINHICDISEGENGLVTLMSRRIIRDNETREDQRLRQNKCREKKGEKPPVTLLSQEGHTNITGRSQKSELLERESAEGVEFDEAHKILISADQLKRISYDQDLTARRFGNEPDWMEAAKAAVVDVELWTDTIDNPALWWRRFLEKRSEKTDRKKKKGGGGFGKSNTGGGEAPESRVYTGGPES